MKRIIIAFIVMLFMAYGNVMADCYYVNGRRVCTNNVQPTVQRQVFLNGTTMRTLKEPFLLRPLNFVRKPWTPRLIRG